jgi:hypothetical protein
LSGRGGGGTSQAATYLARHRSTRSRHCHRQRKLCGRRASAAGLQAVRAAWVVRRSHGRRHGRGLEGGLPWRFRSMSTGDGRKRWIEGISRSLHNGIVDRVTE